MFAAAKASGPKTRKVGTATVPTPAILFSNSTIEDSRGGEVAQCFALVPRIIALHWLRSDSGEVASA